MMGYGIRWRMRWCLAGVVATLVAAGVASPVASAAAPEAPLWQLQTVPTPTDVHPNAPGDDVQKLAVTATGGTFTLEVHAPTVPQPGLTGALPYDATAAEVQSALTSLWQVGAGNLSVTGGPGTAQPREYEITFEGRYGETPVELMRVEAGGLTGGAATIAQTVRGSYPPVLILTATNVGGAATDGSAITVSDAVPPWLTVTKIIGFDMWKSGHSVSTFGGSSGMSCDAPPVVKCTYSGPIDTGDQLMIYVTVASGAGSAAGTTNTMTVNGGGAPEATLKTSIPATSAVAPFGPAPESVFAAASTLQAGAHPDVITSFWLDTSETAHSVANPKDIRFNLPPGLVGSTVGMPRCSMARVVAAGLKHAGKPCPSDSMVGIAQVTLGSIKDGEDKLGSWVVPVYNIAPAPGEPAAFAFDVVALPVRLDTSVLSDGNYAVRVTAADLNESEEVAGSTITIWGVPAEHSGPGEHGETTEPAPYTFGGEDPGQTPVPLLTNPQQCATPLTATMSTDSWVDPGAFKYVHPTLGTLTGCLQVPFGTSFTFLPDTLESGAPAGYTFNLNVPQQNTPETLAASSVKEVSLNLPEGVVVNPSAAWGLRACTNAQFYGPNHPSQEPASPAECPDSSIVGEVEVETPDLEHVLKGQVFLASPECDPCTGGQAQEGKMVRLFIQLVGEGEAGIVVKLEGHGQINQQTGQITTVFEETPQVPFNRMRFVLEGGPRAVLANPRRCGTVKTTGVLTPWNSELAAGEAGPVSNSTPYYEFEINQNCFGARFSPTLKAGMPNIQAGAQGEFTLAFGREDHDQFLKQITLQMPPGLLGTLTGVELCHEAQANAGTCGANSLIGEAQVLTGPGADPFLVEGGQVYLTEGYGGSQFGLSIVVPAVAGPYTLGGLNGEGKEADDGKVVVRTQLYIDPHTAQITAVSGTLPSMLDGIPLQLKAVNVKLNRPRFMFNPTSCAHMAITGTIASQEGMSANVSEPFQVTNCARMPFGPKFTASTSGHTSRKDGASLKVKITYPKGAFGKDANLAYAKVELPRDLPSNLKTLKQACIASTFEANPASCPSASIVGHAVVHTPVLPVPIEGPAYFVSHGGEAFPSLIMVLQGYGVTVELVGQTSIKHGVTSSTFSSTPDVPFESFELTLPEGEYSALDANGSLCRAKPIMPTRLVGQNGKVSEQKTKIKVQGCKPAMYVRKRHVHRDKATIVVQVPSAGKLTASGNGIAKAVKREKSKGGGRVTITVHLKRAAAKRLRHARSHHLNVRVNLSFEPTHGNTLKAHTKVALG